METVDLFAVEIYGDGSFSPGEIIYGDVYLKTNEELTLREIRIEFYGEAKVFWTEAPRKKRLGMQDYTNYEQYLNIAATVYGKGEYLKNSEVVRNCSLLLNDCKPYTCKNQTQTYHS